MLRKLLARLELLLLAIDKEFSKHVVVLHGRDEQMGGVEGVNQCSFGIYEFLLTLVGLVC